jgi:spore germination protein GerM
MEKKSIFPGRSFLVRSARICLTIIICAAILMIVGCDSQPAVIQASPKVNKYVSSVYEDESQDKVIIYYYKSGLLIPTTRGIKPTNQSAEAALNLLFSDYAPKGLENKLGGIKLKSITIAGDTISIDVSKEFSMGQDADLKKAQLLFTLAEFEDIGKVNIFIEGRLFESATSRPKNINLMKALEGVEYTAIQEGEASHDDEITLITVYFIDKEKAFMTPVTLNSAFIKKKIDQTGEVISPTPEEKAKAALFHLIQGPTGISQLTGTLPNNVKLKDFYIKDGTAYVDVSKDMIMSFSSEAENEKVAVESIVQTLTSLDEIQRVQFLIDGNKVGSIAGHTNISIPISRLKWYNFIK